MKKTFLASGNKFYVFFEDKYVRGTWGDQPSLDPGYPLRTKDEWFFPPPFDNRIDAAVQLKGHCYFFSGPYVIRYVRGYEGPGTRDMLFGIRTISQYPWHGFGVTGIDAVATDGSHTDVLVFSGNNYIRVGIDNEYELGEVIGEMGSLEDFALGDFAPEGIDSVLDMNGDKVFISDSRYTQIGIGRGKPVVLKPPTPLASLFFEDASLKRGIGIRPYIRNQWMASLPQAACIYDISLAGTHDSAAFSSTCAPHLWSTQKESISTCLENGVRLLDIRIAVRGTAGAPELFTCHGDTTLGADANIYGPLSEAVSVCRGFLSVNKSEYLVARFKVDDWGPLGTETPSGRTVLVAGAQTKVSNAIQSLLDTSRYSGGFAGPTVAQCAGKFVVLDGINDVPSSPLGLSFFYDDNTDYGPLKRPPVGVAISVQDRYEKLPLAAAREKLAIILAAMNSSAAANDRLHVSFASATQFKIMGVFVNPGFVARILKTKPQKIGWVFFDYALYGIDVLPWGELNCVDIVNASNWGYNNISATALWEPKGL